jgi:hypothetical protein
MSAPEDALETGLEFTQEWDTETDAGSFATTSGLDNLGKDISWSLLRAVDEEDIRGRQYSPELREDISILVERVLSDFSRIDAVEDVTVTQPDDARRTAEVQLTVTAVTDERGEFVFTV